MRLFEIENALASFGAENPREEALIIVEELFGLGRAALMLERDRDFSSPELTALLEKRKEHVPLQHIIGKWGFMGKEFYVSPEHRRRGLGRQMVRKCEDFFAERGADSVWLTADGVTGEPFWRSVGYDHTGEVSAENGQRIFTKRLE